MTDPVTNVEIEDVLSSIRRLVSENARAERREAPAAKPVPGPESEPAAPAAAAPEKTAGETKAQAPLAAGMLLLTPADRVSEPGADGAASEEWAEDSPQQAGQQGDTGEQDYHEPPHGEESTAAADAPGPDGHADEAPSAGLSDGMGAARPADAPEDGDGLARMIEEELAAVRSESAEAQEAVLFSHANARDEEIDTLASRIAGLEAAVAERDDEWEPDGIGEDAYAAAPTEALPWEDELPEAQGGHEHVWEAEAPDEAADDEATEAAPAPGTAEAPDDTEEPDMGAAPLSDMADMAEEEEPDDDTAESAEERASSDGAWDWGDEIVFSSGDLLTGEDAVIDEEMLREMVTEIVRQELQGTLGERITRNVRKLVRREIHRAMAARELD